MVDGKAPINIQNDESQKTMASAPAMEETIPQAAAPFGVQCTQNYQREHQQPSMNTNNHISMATENQPPPPYEQTVVTMPPTAAVQQPNFQQYNNSHNLPNDQQQQQLYPNIRCPNVNDLPAANGQMQKQYMVSVDGAAPIPAIYATPASTTQQSVPPQQITLNVSTAIGQCQHDFITETDCCCLCCLLLLAFFTFPFGLIFLLCIPMAMRKQCGKCGCRK